MEILKIILPALFVLITAYVLLDKLLKNEEKRRNYKLLMENRNTTLPMRLRAYERLILVLERTSPNQLLINTIQPEMNCIEFQTALLTTVRNEFGHNLSQQIYVSNATWSAVKASQESIIKLINACAAQHQPTDAAAALAEHIITVYNDSEQTPTEQATEILKAEVNLLLGGN